VLELSLHILDILENSLEAGASKVTLAIEEDLSNDLLRITVADNGAGMDPATLQRVGDPFFTKRSSRRVGLGIPLFAAAAEGCGGDLSIQSEPGRGTTVVATFQHSHIDRAPLGDMVTTVLSVILGQERVSLHYRHQVGERAFEVDTEEMRARLGDVPFSHPIVRKWLREYLAEGLNSIRS
jgi:anti-sigma regulatory factor (Ser/Thr protein kinase)